MMGFFNASPAAWISRIAIIFIIGAVGMWVKGRIDLSYEADALKDKATSYIYMLQHERERRVAAERFARTTQIRLESAEAEIAGRAKDAVKKATGMVPKSSACDYSSDVISMLNRARGYEP